MTARGPCNRCRGRAVIGLIYPDMRRGGEEGPGGYAQMARSGEGGEESRSDA